MRGLRREPCAGDRGGRSPWGFLPLGRAYDRAWPTGRKIAYFSSLALTAFWAVAIWPYSFFMLLLSGMAGEAYYHLETTFLVYVVTDVLPWIGGSTLIVGIGSLAWAVWLRRCGRYARSVAAQLVPLVPPAIIIGAVALLNGSLRTVKL